jgi:hypothetical protein
MAKDRALFVLMCRLLAEPDSGPPPDDADLDRSESEWARLIYIANLHYAAPLLHDAVYARGLLARLPDDIRGYLVAIRHANAERNDDIRRQVDDFLPALNAVGIEPILLKGGAFLFADPAYGDSRMMVDVDVLVPSGVEDVAWNAMADLGYRAVDDDDYSRAHQMNAIHREGAVATIEIHRTPGPQRTLVTVDEAYADSALVSAESGRCRVMSTDHSVRHALFHGQVQDFHYWFARPQLRTLLDLRRYIDTHGPDIDWAGVVRSFDDEGYGRVVEGTLALLHAWLGVEPPPAVPLTTRSRRYVERCTGRLNRAERELTFWQRWIGWVGVNMLPKRLAFRHRLEDTGRLGRLPVLAARQAAFLAKMSTWPARHFRRNRRGT